LNDAWQKSTAADHHVSNEEVLAHRELYGPTARDVLRYNNARRVQDGLPKDGLAEDENGNLAPVYLLRYQPEAFGGEGAAAIAIGNPDTADNTAVIVPEMTTSVAGGTLDDSDAVNVYEESARTDLGKDTAVVMWMGYDARISARARCLFRDAARVGYRSRR